MRKLVLVLAVCLVSIGVTVFADFDDDDDDGVVEEGVVEEVMEEPAAKEKIIYEPPQVTGSAYLVETFDSEADFKKSWVPSQAKKDGADEEIAKYDGKWSLEEPTDSPLVGDYTLVLKSKAKHHAISSKLDKPYEFKGKPFIVSYEVKFVNPLECGGAYIKLLSQAPGTSLKNFHDKTPYTVMFGPDKCGLDHKLHFIMRHKNPKTLLYEEKHAKKPSGAIDKLFSDKQTHLYTLVVEPDNTFQVLVDNNVVNSGSLLEDMTPPINPPKEVDDSNDRKPSDWDEREKIPDPEAGKPDDWDETEPQELPDEDAVKPDGWLDDAEALVSDPSAEIPDDWDVEMDGEWEAPLIDNPLCKDAPGCGEWTRPIMPNPKYKGKWTAPVIDNPNYQGVWKPRRIENPDWFEDLEPYKMTTISAIGLELWSMTDEIMFDNFMITDDRAVHSSWVQQTWERKSVAESAAASSLPLVQGILGVTKDRPWLWAVFLVVIVLPIVLVVAYCCMPRSSEHGVWGTLMSAAKQRPWLWAVYCVVCLLPIVLLSICLCPRSGPVKPADIAAYKKTDEVTPDDPAPDTTEDASQEAADQEAGGEEAAGEEAIGPGGDNAAKPKKSKAALEAEEESGEGEGEEEGDASEASEEDSKSQEDEKKTDSPRRSPRKRKTRKD